MKQKLAIVIPAYKEKFFSKALDSLAVQTNKEFVLYIGDDCSPYDLSAIVASYEKKMNIVYRRFSENLGGKDLVAQWHRCIAMTQGEPYIWLFSDDDVIGPNCVKSFFETLQRIGDRDLFHFNVKVIDDDGRLRREPAAYPDDLDCFSYYRGKIRGKYISLVVENIFSRSIYERMNGFQQLDLAWGSDTITWMKFAEKDGFTNIHGDFVYWRCGSFNISPNLSPQIAERKMIAMTKVFGLAYKFFLSHKKNCLLTNILGFVHRAVLFAPYVEEKKLKKCLNDFCNDHNCAFFYYILLLLIKFRLK